MKKLTKQLALFGAFFLFATASFAGLGNTYTSKDAKFKISFPTDYEAETERGSGMTVVSLSCTYKGMILLCSAFIYDEVIPEDEYAMKVAEGIIITADAFNSKFKEKKCVHWNGGGDNPGLQNPIKGKVEDGQGGKFKFFGNIYITMAYGIEYRITALSTSKKAYDEDIESEFVNSFKLM